MNYVSASIPKKVSKQKNLKSIQSCKTVSQKKGKKPKDSAPASSPQNYLSAHSLAHPNPHAHHSKLVHSSEYGTSSNNKIDSQKQSYRLIRNDYHNDPPEPTQEKIHNMPSPEYYMSPPPESKKTRSSRSNSRQTMISSNRLLQNLEKQHDNQTKKFSPSANEVEMYRLRKLQLLEKKELMKNLTQSRQGRQSRQSRQSKRTKESKEKK